MVLSESLWFNSSITIENIPLSPSFCGINKTILLFDLFTDDGKFITWNEASAKLRIQNQFKWIQIMNSIPSEWKKMIRGNHVNRDNCCFDMHLNKKNSIVSLKIWTRKNYIHSFSIKLLRLQHLKYILVVFLVPYWIGTRYTCSHVLLQKTHTFIYFNISFYTIYCF